jgi:phosphoadenosine phosphosulfate reductase
VVAADRGHGEITKVVPLAGWTRAEVWAYLESHGIEPHPLYAQGYTSIGCAPCTRAIQPGEASRDGRWWWESGAPKECGIHCSIESGGLEHELNSLLKESS